MDETDDFPFASVEEFEKAIGDYEHHQWPQKERFAYAPPISVPCNSIPQALISPRYLVEEEKRKSPHTKAQSSSKELMDELLRFETHMGEKLEQIYSLYFHLADRLKQLEKRIK